MGTANPFMIGADPEFCILDGRSYVNVGQALGHSGKLGWDHGGRVVEVRPDPKYSAASLCADIFRQLNRRELVPFRRHKWKAGGVAEGQPIGGHIHFDIPYHDNTDTPQLRALNRMAEWFDTLELVPLSECVARRRLGYGAIGETRGSGRRTDGFARLEYRTPPSWLYSPELSHLTLTAFKLAVVDPSLTLTDLQTPSVRPLAKLKNFFASFQTTDDDAAELLPQLLARNALTKFRGDPTTDVKEAWGIPPAPSEAEPATVEAQVGTQSRPGQIRYYNASTTGTLNTLLTIPQLTRTTNPT